MARRTKSMQQINQQAIRLVEAEYNRPNTDRARMERIRDINTRYRRNIANAFGESDGFVRNEDYTRQVSQRTYMGLNQG